jgi:hypothetical protein
MDGTGNNYNIAVGLKTAGCEVVMDNKGWKDIQKNIWTLPKIEKRGIYLIFMDPCID